MLPTRAVLDNDLPLASSMIILMEQVNISIVIINHTVKYHLIVLYKTQLRNDTTVDTYIMQIDRYTVKDNKFIASIDN